MAIKKKDRKVMVAGTLGMFFFGVEFFVLGAVLPLFKNKFGISDVDSSLLVSLLPIGTLFGSLVFGPGVDRYGYKPFLLMSALLGCLGLEILAFSRSVDFVKLGVLVIGFSGGMLNGSTGSLISEISDDNSKSANLSLSGSFYCVGALFIPLLFASALKVVSFETIIGCTGGMMGLTFIYFLFIDFPKSKFKQGFPIKMILGMIKEKTLLIVSFSLLFQSCLEALANNWTPSYLVEAQGFTPEKAQSGLIFIAIGMAISRVSQAFILKKVKGVYVIAASMGMIALGALSIMLIASTVLTIFGYLLIGLGLAAGFPVALGVLGERYKEASGTAFSIALVVSLLGNILINILVGFIGVEFIPYLQIGCALIMVALFVRVA